MLYLVIWNVDVGMLLICFVVDTDTVASRVTSEGYSSLQTTDYSPAEAGARKGDGSHR